MILRLPHPLDKVEMGDLYFEETTVDAAPIDSVKELCILFESIRRREDVDVRGDLGDGVATNRIAIEKLKLQAVGPEDFVQYIQQLTFFFLNLRRPPSEFFTRRFRHNQGEGYFPDSASPTRRR